ncbi:phosphonate ABC transporter, permease protein PhnE [Polymorphobacter fuscus]|uniref:Phosphonate ABC transporter, permease protein PhnE n=1 Tax=Sandarakinorhabdus fusca TaxID=1439888 RepID=A0A7C9GNQ2_9SPHN|nr:phosphonate ABC transporter, permease protein PhnE [Polymorphobacter fuscus]KAB7647668.1 phosphonate ABC transporter, permease protein PhnE [Polymorphobacter fuscus]MQT16955.1 phosphonate ABC transporter, permease protein PhnE [Polymorphobacter fuscus]NJC09055.1 phosphonate transport system permease protein [Polymorphobacter fuscus]
MTATDIAALARPSGTWHFPSPFGWRTLLVAIVAFMVLFRTGADVEIGPAIFESGKGIAAVAGLADDSQVARGFGTILVRMFPPQLAEITEIGRIAGFDRDRLPLFARVETQTLVVQSLDPETMRMVARATEREVLVEPFGYLRQVVAKLIETLEIATWGTLLAVLIGVPLAILGARNLSPHPLLVILSRCVVSLLRSVPELISALFFVLAYGFGPAAGVLALALHAAGFLGKFYAEDIENADPGPQEALTAVGSNRLKVLRYAILPQVLPQYVAYTLYILDRNVRMATVIGLVGAGGIGMELKGRYDLYQYAHVGTILIAIFVLVFAIDQLSSWLRRRLI